MSVAYNIDGLEEDLAQLEPVLALNQQLLGELVKAEPPPADLDTVRSSLRLARDFIARGKAQAAEPLALQAHDALQALRQWLAVGDLAISPFTLRTYLERSRPQRSLLQVLIRYHLTKHPHAEGDRDKLDFLLTAYFNPEPAGATQALARPADLRQELEALCTGPAPPGELSDPAQVMLHEFESLIAMIPDFTDFDQLVQARMVERVRALKTNLAAEFYQPRVLATVVRFNLSFRRHFEMLFHQQLRQVREETRRRLEQAEELILAIEAAFEALLMAGAQGAAQPRAAEEVAAAALGKRVGRPHEVLDERPPIDRLVRGGQEKQKENELRGIISRITRFLEKLPPEQAGAETVLFRLRQGELPLQSWEREAFDAAAMAAAPESTRAIQYCLGVVAWIEEESARYQETRDDRYLWKAHVDLLSYAVARALELLTAVRGLLREDAPAGEVPWFDELRDTSRRLGAALDRLSPVFDEPAAA